MGIFDKIKNAIWGEAQAASSPSPQAATSATSSAPPPPAAGTPPTATPGSGAAAAPAQPGRSTAPSAGASSAPVDVAPILDAAVENSGQKLDWRHSIVDLMKALKLDSSLAARKELAEELNYTGDTNDSATMNMWLHKALMKKLPENGGKGPADLTDCPPCIGRPAGRRTSRCSRIK